MDATSLSCEPSGTSYPTTSEDYYVVIRELALNFAIESLSGPDPGYGRLVEMISVQHTRTSKLNK